MQELAVSLSVLFTLTFQIFAILNPMSVIPTYLVLTEGLSVSERRSIVLKAIIVILFIATLVLLAGNAFLNLLGVSINAFRFAGGMLLLISALDMFSGISRGKRLDDPLAHSMSSSRRNAELTELAAVPLATPLLLGPGTITLILTLSLEEPPVEVFLAIVMATIVSGVILAVSTFLHTIIHESGIKVLGRLMALVVSAIAIEFMHSSLAAWGLFSS
ncbi:MAG TPA: MarC family protein [Candidatus Hodarchaeales archaeon]|nr:MarC family protein [Candidatus Hodarchaeales archaeon]